MMNDTTLRQIAAVKATVNKGATSGHRTTSDDPPGIGSICAAPFLRNPSSTLPRRQGRAAATPDVLMTAWDRAYCLSAVCGLRIKSEQISTRSELGYEPPGNVTHSLGN